MRRPASARRHVAALYLDGMTAAAAAFSNHSSDVGRRAGFTPRAFLLAQVGGWLLFGIVYFLALLPGSAFAWWRLLVFKVFWALTGVAVSSALAVVYHRARMTERHLTHAALMAAAGSLVVGSAWVLALGLLVSVMTGSTLMLYSAKSFPFVALNHFLIILSWSLSYLALSYAQKSQTDKRQSLAALGHAREAQLTMLRYQLNPHFLFNAMTSVRALIAEDPERARTMISRLSDFLRYTLGNSGGTTVSVAEELEVARDYLQIEQMRFEERLDIDVTMQSAASRERIPGFLLHPLIDNAIKHGNANGGALRVRVRATMEDGTLRVEVANTGRYVPDEKPSEKIGVTNVRERLAATYPGRHTFDIGQDGDWVRAIIKIRSTSGHAGAA